MAGFAITMSDDSIALVTCCSALFVCGFALQLVHFIQHRKRPSSFDDVNSSEAKPAIGDLPQPRSRENAA